MKIARKILMKHTMQRARDLEISYEVDLVNRSVNMQVGWIDTALIEWFLKFSLLHMMNEEMTRIGQAEFANVSSFHIEMAVADKSRFSLQLVQQDFEPRETTLVMRLKEI